MENIIETEIKKEEEFIKESIKKSIFVKPLAQSVFGIIIILLSLVVFSFWRMNANQIKTDNANIVAPIINLAPMSSGVLEETYVKVGDVVSANTPVAKIGGEIVVAKVGGIIVSVSQQEGQIFNPSTFVVSMININKERVIAEIDENKGLKDIKIGQPVIFTIDAFGSKQYKGVVDEISQVSNDSGIVFNISDKREVKKFDVKIRFSIADYPELKPGMSARVTIFTK